MTPERERLLSLLAELSETWPGQRLGQLVGNLTDLTEWAGPTGSVEVSDVELIEAAETVLANQVDRSADQLAEVG